MKREELFQSRHKEAHSKVTTDLTMEDLDLVLKQLINGKSRDPWAYANELFKPDYIGSYLRTALLHLSNEIKKQPVFREALVSATYPVSIRTIAIGKTSLMI